MPPTRPDRSSACSSSACCASRAASPPSSRRRRSRRSASSAASRVPPTSSPASTTASFAAARTWSSDVSTLAVENVTKTYRGGVLANDDISLDVAAGGGVGVVGAEGGGEKEPRQPGVSLLLSGARRKTPRRGGGVPTPNQTRRAWGLPPAT